MYYEPRYRSNGNVNKRIYGYGRAPKPKYQSIKLKPKGIAFAAPITKANLVDPSFAVSTETIAASQQMTESEYIKLFINGKWKYIKTYEKN